MLIIPDVSCEVSFSSKEAKTQFQMANALSVSAKVGGGGWGVEFSASAEYKTASSEMRSGEYVFIVSTATCGYYYNELLTRQPPKLHPLFSTWVTRLAATNDRYTYFEFFETFGTHFAKRVVYGARYSFQYKMKWDKYEKSQESNINIAVEASYSGAFSVSGGAGMTSDQKKAAESFSKSVESKMITTGAVPPSDGQANSWASAVKENPLPISYELDSIENLFTPALMHGQDQNKIKRIVANIGTYKMQYCGWLKSKGQVNTCASLKPGIEMDRVRMLQHYIGIHRSYTDCIDNCLADSRCLAITYCMTCRANTANHGICYKYGPYRGLRVSSTEDPLFASVIFYEKIHQTFTLSNTKIKGSPRTLEKKSDQKASQSRCQELCLKDPDCTAFSYQASRYVTTKCLLYGADYILGLATSRNTLTKFVPWRKRAQALKDFLEQQRATQNNFTAMTFQQTD